VSSNKVAIVSTTEDGLKPVTLRDWLKTHDYYNAACDTEVGIRFQTVFLRDKAEFCVEHYNYQTSNDKDPKNLLLFCTSQGCSLSQDTCGPNKLYKVMRGDDGELYNHWFEVEASSHAVGGAQAETQEERQDALSRGKATASVIGVEAMGTRFNVVMSVQIPLAQQYKVLERKTMMAKGYSVASSDLLEWAPASTTFTGLGSVTFSGVPMNGTASLSATPTSFGSDDGVWKKNAINLVDPPMGGTQTYYADSAHESVVYRGAESAPTRGAGMAVSRSSAARVSHGKRVGHFRGVHVANRMRHADEHITITVTMYYVVDRGEPSEEDAKKACEDLDNLYKSCYWDGRLGDEEVKKVKLVHEAGGEEVKNYNVFPL
jgi:hypothetical protein